MDGDGEVSERASEARRIEGGLVMDDDVVFPLVERERTRGALKNGWSSTTAATSSSVCMYSRIK